MKTCTRIYFTRSISIEHLTIYDNSFNDNNAIDKVIHVHFHPWNPWLLVGKGGKKREDDPSRLVSRPGNFKDECCNHAERERGWEKAVEGERETRERGEVRARGRHKHTGKRARRVPSRILRREGPS